MKFIHLPIKMEPTVSSETSAIITQTPGNYPKKNKLQVIHIYHKCGQIYLIHIGGHIRNLKGAYVTKLYSPKNGQMNSRNEQYIPICGLNLETRPRWRVNRDHSGYAMLFLGRFAKIEKSDCYFRHVCLSVRVQQLGYHWTDFHEILYMIFRKSIEKIQFSVRYLKSPQSADFVNKKAET